MRNKILFGLFLFLVSVTAVSAYHGTYRYPSHYTGNYYTSSVNYNTGYGYGWDRTFVGDGITTHSAGYIEHGPYRCLGSGCGYWNGNWNTYGGWSGPYYNAKWYPYGGSCSGYWRGSCEWHR